jgi:hypothetical protein
MLTHILPCDVGLVCSRVGARPIVVSGYIICATMLFLLRLHDRDDLLHEVGLFVDLLCVGTAMCMVMTPVLSDIFQTVEGLELEKPGRFGKNGAFAQAVGCVSISSIFELGRLSSIFHFSHQYSRFYISSTAYLNFHTLPVFSLDLSSVS